MDLDNSITMEQSRRIGDLKEKVAKDAWTVRELESWRIESTQRITNLQAEVDRYEKRELANQNTINDLRREMNQHLRTDGYEERAQCLVRSDLHDACVQCSMCAEIRFS